MNHCFFSGRLVRDPEIRYAKEGNDFATFDLAVKDRFKDEEQTHFLKCVAFGHVAKIVSKIGKGQMISMQARASQRKYQDKEGKDRTILQFIVYEIHPTEWVDANAPTKAEPHVNSPEDDGVPF